MYRYTALYVQARPRVKFKDKVAVTLIDDNSYHHIINNIPILIDDRKHTAKKIGYIAYYIFALCIISNQNLQYHQHWLLLKMFSMYIKIMKYRIQFNTNQHEYWIV